MHRAFGYAGAWLAATAVGVTVSWFGCVGVLNGSSPTPPEPAAARAHAVGLSEPAVSDTMRPAQTAVAAPVPPRITTPRASRSSRPTVPSDPPTFIRYGTPPPQPPRPITPRGTPSATPSPNAGGEPQPVQRTYQVIGGQATLQFTQGQVQVVSMEPAPGYRCSVSQNWPGELVVIFNRPHQESDLHAAWDGGPSSTVTEYWW